MAPAAGAPIVALGEDLLREVFIHLPASADLLRAAAACKPFLRAARSAPFLRRFRRRHPSCPRLLGCLLLYPNRRSGKSQFVPISASSSPSSSSSSSSSAAAAADRGDFALSFLPGGGWLGLGAATWKHLDCRNGRLLLENLRTHELAVADPISRRYVSLPAPPAGRAVGYGLFTDDGDKSEFRVVCVSRDAASPELRALVLASGELSWADVAGIACQPNLAVGSRVMQANRSLYWRLEGGERMVAFSTASMELSVLDLPPALRDLRFDAMDRGKEEDANVLHLLTMTGYRIEVWAGTADGDGGMAWRQVEKSLRFHKALTEIIDPSLESYERIDPSVQSYRDDIDVIGVVAGLVFFRKWTHIFTIDLETMKLKRLPKADCLGALIYPYTVAWPPSLLNPAEQDKRLM
ncbi:hypothetical protein BDA96_09G045000 [Sorghum bicolor]|jgi:hypothetical protein|uniref:F-box protein AT5G49610-like beta-propeller domain-containing protein n=2 Tax=Sorghum bicolor TaxID=4558 RepID=A0A921Q7D2_SORBI|nr:uncharacterized protein LOC8069488 [Sorghum bicolor]EES17701.1 hypothetical protein SORBI_3009G042400 [Sorghum bicolor]KAG0516934.1 hypothetical protein BDA96_09G045000 [Sorghum bicolor]|eukprot:XP_002439271.1 uncharacterized protein LOC8069488 [Sorghum bicolor]